VIKNRNFDPATRTLRKYNPGEDAEIPDTVEKDVEGLAEKIIAEDEQRRAMELVRVFLSSLDEQTPNEILRTCSTSLQSDLTGISNVNWTKNWQSWSEERKRPYIR